MDELKDDGALLVTMKSLTMQQHGYDYKYAN